MSAAPVPDVAAALSTKDQDSFKHFENIFSKFSSPDELEATREALKRTGGLAGEDDMDDEDDMDMDDDENESIKKLSNRMKKEASRLTVAQLKQLVARPDGEFDFFFIIFIFFLLRLCS